MPSLLDREVMARLGLTAIGVEGYPQNAKIVEVAKVFSDLRDIHLPQWLATSEEIRQSQMFSDSGKKSELRVAGERALERLAGYDRWMLKYREAVEDLRASIAVTPVTQNEVVNAIEQMEIRQHLSRLPKERVFEAWLTAIDKGDQRTFDAIRNAPPVYNFLPAKTITEGESKWAERKNPEAAKEIRDLARAVSATEELLASVRNTIYKDSGLESPASLSVTARTGIPQDNTTA